MNDAPRLSLLILARDEWENLVTLLAETIRELDQIGETYELVIIDGGSACNVALPEAPLRILSQELSGYGNAFRQGIQACRGDIIITIDADYSHPPAFLGSLYQASGEADLVIASRYISGGKASMSRYRAILSRTLCLVYRILLRLPVKDLSSGYRAYKRSSVCGLQLKGRHFDVLLEVLVHLISTAGTIKEIPFNYEPRRFGSSQVRIFIFGANYLKTLLRCCWIRFCR
jgi:dolichol-phosphate mannosyltransferase